MWLWIIFIILICCVLNQISDSIIDSSKEKEAKKINAKRPDAFVRLFSEEFPEFSNHITFSKAEAALTAWERALTSSEFRKQLKLFNKSEFKDSNSATEGMRFAALSVANQISPEFARHTEQHPEKTYIALSRAITSSLTLANQ